MKQALSSVGRAVAPHATGHGFKPLSAYQKEAPVVESADTSGLNPEALVACECKSRREHQKKLARAQEILNAAELSKVIKFNDAVEARLYRECYIKTHTGVIDMKEVQRLLTAGGR